MTWKNLGILLTARSGHCSTADSNMLTMIIITPAIKKDHLNFLSIFETSLNKKHLDSVVERQLCEESSGIPSGSALRKRLFGKTGIKKGHKRGKEEDMVF